jgi:small conductance mechanosensitive channel
VKRVPDFEPFHLSRFTFHPIPSADPILPFPVAAGDSMPDSLPWLTREEVLSLVAAVLPKLAAAILVFLAFYVLLRVVQPALRAILRRANFAPALIHLLVDGVVRGTVLVIGLVMAASQLGINIAAALAGLGVLGIAVGFAAQETIANMIAGFLIFWDRPFKVGDWVTTQDRYGEVRDITLRTTRIRTLDNTYVVIPNKQVIGELLVNHSMYGETRVNVPIGIAYKESITEARQVMLEAVATLDGVLKDPAPSVVAAGLGDSSVDLTVRVWIAQAVDEVPVRFRVVEACKVALDKAGIEIPFPHLQLFVDDVTDRVWEGLRSGRSGRA